MPWLVITVTVILVASTGFFILAVAFKCQEISESLEDLRPHDVRMIFGGVGKALLLLSFTTVWLAILALYTR